MEEERHDSSSWSRLGGLYTGADEFSDRLATPGGPLYMQYLFKASQKAAQIGG